MGYVPMHWEELGRIPPQSGPKTDGRATSEENGWDVGISPAGGGDGGVRVTGGADLHIPPPEHSLKVHYEKAHYGPVSVRREASRVKVGQLVVVEGGLGIGRDADGSLVDRTEGVGGVDGQDNDGYIKLVRCKDTVAN